MRPRTKIQKEVLELSASLHPLTKAQQREALKNVPYFIGHEARGKVTCMMCGHVFESDGSTEQNCPHCRRKLNIIQTSKHSAENVECFVLLDTCKEWQIMRYFHVVTASKEKGKVVVQKIHEIMQRWINGKDYVIIAKHRDLINYRIIWNYYSEFEVRNVPGPYNYNGIDSEGFCYLIKSRLQPAIAHCPYDGSGVSISRFTFYRALLASPYAETIFKTGNIKLFEYMAQQRLFLSKEHIAAVRIALKNKYNLKKDLSMWFDMVDALVNLGKDVHNAAYVCPKDLHEAHDRWTQLWNRKKRERDMKLKTKNAILNNERYIKRMQPFLGIVLTDGVVTIHVLQNVPEFMEEADVMKHCVFANEYYNDRRHPSSLIMSACVEGKRTETVELSLSSFTVCQSRGFKNMETPYHARIVNLVKDNIQVFKKAAGAV